MRQQTHGICEEKEDRELTPNYLKFIQFLFVCFKWQIRLFSKPPGSLDKYSVLQS
jgi:hypothetical protein